MALIPGLVSKKYTTYRSLIASYAAAELFQPFLLQPFLLLLFNFVIVLPNVAPQPRPESAAQGRLKGVGCRRWFGNSVAPIVELVAEPVIE